MPEKLASAAQNPWVKGALGTIVLLVAGVAGGSVLGFRVEPEECAQARVELATCAAKLELVDESLDEAKVALERVKEVCAP
tara:strand:- start:126 stop:368 length:243 start_codon:yes stop_codon:yes gene_type:complete